MVAAHGLIKFGAPGDEFDPRLHEALMHAHIDRARRSFLDLDAA